MWWRKVKSFDPKPLIRVTLVEIFDGVAKCIVAGGVIILIGMIIAEVLPLGAQGPFWASYLVVILWAIAKALFGGGNNMRLSS